MVNMKTHCSAILLQEAQMISKGSKEIVYQKTSKN